MAEDNRDGLTPALRQARLCAAIRDDEVEIDHTELVSCMEAIGNGDCHSMSPCDYDCSVDMMRFAVAFASGDLPKDVEAAIRNVAQARVLMREHGSKEIH